MKIRMQMKRVTIEYSDVIEVEVPSNDNYEAQFVCEALYDSDSILFNHASEEVETDYEEIYIGELENLELEIEVIKAATVKKSDRLKNIATIGRLWSLSKDEIELLDDSAVAVMAKTVLKSLSNDKPPNT